MKRPLHRGPCALVILAAIALAFLTQSALAGTFTVHWPWGPDDIGDDNPGDGVCQARKFAGYSSGPGFYVPKATYYYGCTMRAAVEESNANVGPDTIVFRARGDSDPYEQTITLHNGELVVTDSLTIDGSSSRRPANVFVLNGNGRRIFRLNNGTFTLNGMTLANGNSGNTEPLDGGAIYVAGGLLRLDNVWLRNNAATRYGGALFITNGSAELNRMTISNNTAAFGGGVATRRGSLTMTNSTVSTNTANGGGNSAEAHGGGIYAYSVDSQYHTVRLRHVTVTGNSAGQGRGGGVAVVNGSSQFRFSNTLIAANTAATDDPDYTYFNGIAISDGYNLIGDNPGDAPAFLSPYNYHATDLRDQPANFGPLGLPQGATVPMHGLEAGSAAIDKGKSFGVLTDQRGGLRPIDNPTIANATDGDGSDIGAYEVGGMVVNSVADAADATIGDGVCATSGGVCTLRAAFQELNASPSGGSIYFNLPGNAPHVIELQSALPNTEKNMKIIGPGANQLTIRRSGAAGTPAFRIFTFYPLGSARDLHISLSGVTLTNGLADQGTIAGAQGGGVYVGYFETVTLDGVHVTNNATSGSGSGGGIYSSGNLIVRHSTVSGNSALNPDPTYDADAGGIYASTDDGRFFQLINSTVSGNSADGPGGGLYLNKASTNGASGIFNSTIAFNTCGTSGGGINVADSSTGRDQVRLRSTIIAGNTGRNRGADDLSSERDVISEGYNLVQRPWHARIDRPPGGWQPTDLPVGTNPLLQPLRDNGGTTPTHRLGANSPAIDKGNAFGLGADQRGFVRPFDNPAIPNPTGGDGSDIGAVEIQQATGLTFKVQPSTAIRDNAIVPPVEVQIVDETGQPAAVERAVTIALGANPTGATLSGVKTVLATHGVATFNDLSVNNVGSGYTLVATSDVGSATSAAFTVEDTPTRFEVSAAANATAGSPFNFTVTVRDAGGNRVTAYRGTVAFTSNDSAAGLPTNYTFTAADAGQRPFTATLNTAGVRTITATDVAENSRTGTSTNISVAPATPAAPDLIASSDTGTSSSDNVTASSAPTFALSGLTSGASVALLRDGASTPVATGTASGTTLQLTDPGASDGAHSYAVRQTLNGQTSATSTALAVVIDTIAPVAASTPDLQAGSDSGSSNSDNITRAASRVFDIGGTEAGASVVLLRNGAAVASATGNGGSITLTDAGTIADGAHSYTARQTDLAGNFSSSAGMGVTTDTAAPTPTFSSSAPDPTKISPIPVSVTFSEAVVGFAASDIAASNGTIGNFSGSAASYTFNLTPSGQATVTANIAANVATDAAGNGNAAASQFSRRFDSVAPTVQIAVVSPDPRSTSVPSIQIVFSEAVAGLEMADLTLKRNGGANLLSGAQTLSSADNIVWTLANLSTITATEGAYELKLVAAGSGIADNAANALSSDATETWATDTTGATATVNQATGQEDPTILRPINFTAVFSDPVSDFTAADVIVTGTANPPTNITVTQIAPNNGTTYKIAVDGMTEEGPVIVSLPAGAGSDAFGHPSAASTSTDNQVIFGAATAADLIVTNTADDGAGSLRRALQVAHQNPPQSPATTNTITFAIPPTDSGYDANTGVYTIGLTTAADETYGRSALLVSSNVTLDGGQSRITITRDASAPAMRLFQVAPGGDLTVRRLTLAGGVAQGGNGGAGAGDNASRSGGGGGGAAGLGGAIYNRGNLTVDRSTLHGHQAIGGSGGPGNTSFGGFSGPYGGGGGGGLLGNGGNAGTTGGAGGPPNGGAVTGGNGGPGGDGGGGGGGSNYNTVSGDGGDGGAGGYGGGGGGGRNGASGGFGGGGGGGGYRSFAGSPGGGSAFGGGAGAATNHLGTGGRGGGGAGLGGAIFNDAAASLTLTNSTLAANTAQGGTGAAAGSGFGGAVFNRSGTVTATNSTVAGNTAAQGGGAIYNLGDAATATVTLTNTIAADSAGTATDVQADQINGGTSNATGSFAVVESNGTSNGAAPLALSTSSSSDPMLEKDSSQRPLLQDNLGPARTIRPLRGSPAIDKGHASAVATDQRGEQRPYRFDASIALPSGGDGSDIGAVEALPPFVRFSSATAAVSESGGSATLTVTRLGDLSAASSVSYRTLTGTASASDYTGTSSGLINFAANEATQQLAVPITNDTTDELVETFTIELTGGSNALVRAPVTATVTIDDDDQPPTFQFSAIEYDVTEGTSFVTVTVTASHLSEAGATVRCATGDGSASSSSDFTSLSGELAFGPGDLNRAFYIPIDNDSLYEAVETLSVALSGATEGTIGSPATASVRITDDDTPPVVQFASVDYTVNEAAGSVTVTVTKTGTTAALARVEYTTSDLTAVAGTDYTTTSGELVFAAGEASQQITVPIIDDDWNDPGQQFRITLSNPQGASLGTGGANIATINLTDNELEPRVRVNQATAQLDPTIVSPVRFHVLFGKPVNGFDASDVQMSGTAGATTATITADNTYGERRAFFVDVTGMTQTGTITLAVPAGAATDDAGQPNTASSSLDNTVAFRVIAFEVNSTADGDDGSCGAAGVGNGCTLREAIAASNQDPGGTIGFAVTGTITLASELPAISGKVKIDGPGAAQLTVRRADPPPHQDDDGAEFAGQTVGVQSHGGNHFSIFTIAPGANVELAKLTISNGKAPGTRGGGGIYNEGAVTVSECVISGNFAEYGAGIYSYGGDEPVGPIVVINSTITANTAESGGGGIYAINAAVTLLNSTVSGNTARRYSGGGLVTYTSPELDRPLTIVNSTISGNSAGLRGGGIDHNCRLVAMGSTISGNSAGSHFEDGTRGGGGIFSSTGGTATLTNVTITNNRIHSNDYWWRGAGGGIYAANSAGVLLRSTIVAGNFHSDPTPAGNSQPDRADNFIAGDTVSALSSYNVVGPRSSGLPEGQGNKAEVENVRLGPLADNGGATQTHLPLGGSPVLNAGAALLTLASAIDAAQTSFEVAADTAGIPTGVGFILLVDAEQMIVTATTPTLLTVVRGANGTTPAAHTSGAAVYAPHDQRGAGFSRRYGNAPDIGATEAQAGTPDRLVFKVQPTDAIVSVPITPAVQVQILDAGGAPTASTAEVTLDRYGVFGNPNGTTVAAINGIATFSDERTSAMGDFTLWASSAELAPVESSTFRVTSPAIVAGTKTVSGSFDVGATVTYTIVLHNSGPAPQFNNAGQEFTDVLPAGLTLVSAASSRGARTLDLPNNTFKWSGMIPKDGSVTITIQATVNDGQAGRTIASQGSIAYDADGDGTNEAAALTDDPNVGGDGDPTAFQVKDVPPLPDPTPTPSPTPTATPTPAPSASPSPTANPTPSISPIPTASPSPTASASPTASPSPSPAKALNISTRLRVETGDNVMIGGFIITGNDSKQVIIRALGPSLRASGVDNAVNDPVLELRGSEGELIFENDNWRDAQETAIVDSTVAPTNDAEAAIVVTLAPGAYTAVVTGKGASTGVGLVEVYDLSADSNSELANISTRGLVLTETNVLIGGFILGGTETRTRVAVRALGPSLIDAGVANALENPTLDLRDGNGERLAFSDNWRDDPEQAAELIVLGLSPRSELEAALVRTLPPGSYTAIVAGDGGGIGVGLVEVYNVK